jgi:hypothetical protein
MAQAESLRQLRQLSDDELIRKHDAVAQRTEVGIAYYLDALKRREGNRVAQRVYWLTCVLVALTAVITASRSSFSLNRRTARPLSSCYASALSGAIACQPSFSIAR